MDQPSSEISELPPFKAHPAKLDSADMGRLKEITLLSQQLEKNSTDGHFNPVDLAHLQTLIKENATSNHSEIQRLAELADHLHRNMTVRHFVNFILPIERCLDRNLRDDDFLTTREDRPAESRLLRPMIFILDNLRSSFNVGSILRMADGVGAESIYFSGYTPRADSAAVRKTALGSENGISFREFDRVEAAISVARSLGYQVVALETAEKSQDLYQPLPEKIAWLVGNERFGIESSHLKMCNQVRTIPQFGLKNSLNVAVALGIAAYEWQRQWPIHKS